MALLGQLQYCLLRCSLLHHKGQQETRFQKPFAGSSFFLMLKFSTKWSFSSVLPLCLSHTFSHIHIPHSSCPQNSVINFLLSVLLLEFSVLETFCQDSHKSCYPNNLVQIALHSPALLSCSTPLACCRLSVGFPREGAVTSFFKRCSFTLKNDT